MFFKKKVSVEDYCTSSLRALFAKEREATWEVLRIACNDDQLTRIDAQLYYTHLKAVFTQLMLIAIAKKCNMDTSVDAHLFVMTYLKKNGLSEIDEISKGYNQAFASSYTDGIQQMVSHFADRLTAASMRQETVERLYAEFYAILMMFFNDFKSIKLTASR